MRSLLSLRYKTQVSSDVEVKVLRIQGGLLKTTTKPQPVEAAEWTARIQRMLKK